MANMSCSAPPGLRESASGTGNNEIGGSCPGWLRSFMCAMLQRGDFGFIHDGEVRFQRRNSFANVVVG